MISRRDVLRLAAGVPLVIGLGGARGRAFAGDDDVAELRDAVRRALAGDRLLVFVVVPKGDRDPRSEAAGVRRRTAQRLHRLLRASDADRRLLAQAVIVVATADDLAGVPRLGAVVEAARAAARPDPEPAEDAAPACVVHVVVAEGEPAEEKPLRAERLDGVALDAPAGITDEDYERIEGDHEEEDDLDEAFERLADERLTAPLARLLDALRARLPGDDPEMLRRRARRQMRALGPLDQGRVDALIARLGAPSWDEREAAARELLPLREKAFWALALAHATSDDPEVGSRCRKLLAPEDPEAAPVGTGWADFEPDGCANNDPYDAPCAALCGMASAGDEAVRTLRIVAGE